MAGLLLRSVATSLLAMLSAASASAQPVDFPVTPADGTPLPSGVRVLKLDGGHVYANPKGQVLYGMDMRTVLRWVPDPARYCAQDCQRDWVPLLAPAGTRPNIRYPAGFEKPGEAADTLDPRKAPDWTVIEGAQGPQWVYKGWHLVFTQRSASRSAAAPDGTGGMTWNTLKFVPPPPAIEVPGTVATAFFDDAYALTDKDGRVLFTGKCDGDCSWQPLAAPMAASGLGDWKVTLAGDRPAWALKGKRIFVSTEANPHTVPSGAKVLRP
jgi:predicted lipoprotein with Yx(FWY)xxD motif